MRPSFNGLDETRRANQSDSREAASSARNVFDVARFTVYNRHPIIGFQPPISNPAWYGGREGGGGGGGWQKYEARLDISGLSSETSDGGW